MIPLNITAILVGSSLLAGTLAGWTARDWKADAADGRAASALLAEKDQRMEDMRGEAGRFEAFRSQIEPATNTVRETIRETYKNGPPVPAECALRPDALRVLNAHIQVANRAAGGQFESPLPADPPAPVPGP